MNKMLKQTLQKIESLLKEIFPELLDSLNPSATESQIQALEDALQVPLPEDVKTLYRWHDGERNTVGLFFGMSFLSIEEALEEWKIWAEIAAEGDSVLDSSIASVPSGFIKENYANRLYLPISADGGGNNIVVDLDPDEKGQYGQVINSGRDEEMRYVIASSVSKWMEFVLHQLQSNNFIIEQEEDTK